MQNEIPFISCGSNVRNRVWSGCINYKQDFHAAFLSLSSGFLVRESRALIEEQFKGSAVLVTVMGYLPPGFRHLWSNQRLLNVVEQFIGPDIAGML